MAEGTTPKVSNRELRERLAKFATGNTFGPEHYLRQAWRVALVLQDHRILGRDWSNRMADLVLEGIQALADIEENDHED